ncbi:MAG: hypothetical protein NC337_02845 [Roseburia sp.]|nr:hypothetical protein [Roseburia sp.]MCM1235027.1 hypothetical protein [Ruminococcus flavefaciens]
MDNNEKLDLIIEKLEKLDKMEERFDRLEFAVRDIRLTLENETNKNIMRVAEGHLDLSRKLDEALKTENEKEMIAIRVNILENELRRLKERLDQIA